jgi:hypothetical protein
VFAAGVLRLRLTGGGRGGDREGDAMRVRGDEDTATPPSWGIAGTKAAVNLANGREAVRDANRLRMGVEMCLAGGMLYRAKWEEVLAYIDKYHADELGG